MDPPAVRADHLVHGQRRTVERDDERFLHAQPRHPGDGGLVLEHGGRDDGARDPRGHGPRTGHDYFFSADIDSHVGQSMVQS